MAVTIFRVSPPASWCCEFNCTSTFVRCLPPLRLSPLNIIIILVVGGLLSYLPACKYFSYCSWVSSGFCSARAVAEVVLLVDMISRRIRVEEDQIRRRRRKANARVGIVVERMERTAASATSSRTNERTNDACCYFLFRNEDEEEPVTSARDHTHTHTHMYTGWFIVCEGLTFVLCQVVFDTKRLMSWFFMLIEFLIAFE